MYVYHSGNTNAASKLFGGMCNSRKYSYPSHGRSLEICRGRGVLKVKILFQVKYGQAGGQEYLSGDVKGLDFVKSKCAHLEHTEHSAMCSEHFTDRGRLHQPIC